MFKKFMSYFPGAASKMGQGAKKKARKQKTQKSNAGNPFGDFFKDIKTQTAHNQMQTEEAMLILNFEKDKLPTMAQIEERYSLKIFCILTKFRFQEYFAVNNIEEEGSMYLQSKIRNAKATLMVDLHNTL